MSFSPFGQLAGDSTSEPATPLDSALEGYSPWDTTIERDHEQQQHSQQQSQEQLHQQSPLIQPPIHTIQLEAQHALESSGPSPSPVGHSPPPAGHGIIDTTPIPLHLPHHGLGPAEGRLEMPESEAQMYTLVDSWVSSGSSVSGMASNRLPPPQLSASGLRRSARAHPHRSTGPYPSTRPQSVVPASRRHTTSTAAAEPSSRLDTGKYKEIPTMQPQQFRFVNMRVPSTHSAASSGIPSPGSTSGGHTGQVSIAGSPAAASSSRQQSIVPQASPRVPGNTLPVASTSLSIQQTQHQFIPTTQRQEHQPQQPQQPQRRKYKIRADGDYQPETGILTLMLELPGVDRRDVRVTLATTRYTRVRYLKVYGVVDSVLPPLKVEDVDMYPETVVRERKFGEFSRSFVVPAHLKKEDVVVTLKRGILTLNVYLGPPLEVEDIQEIPVN